MTERHHHMCAHPNGYTIVVYLPPEAPDATVQQVFDRIADVWVTAKGDEGGGWDAFMVGLAGDPLDIDGPSEAVEELAELDRDLGIHQDYKAAPGEETS